jgi:hypothetical protein
VIAVVPVTKDRLWAMTSDDIWKAGYGAGVPRNVAVSMTADKLTATRWQLRFEW